MFVLVFKHALGRGDIVFVVVVSLFLLSFLLLLLLLCCIYEINLKTWMME